MALGLFTKLFGGKRKETSLPSGIYFFNTMSGKKEEFAPIKPRVVKMYHCGPTVYGYQHIGNYRAYVFADTLKRLFLAQGYKVDQVINITDVGHLTSDEDEGEDKIELGAKREKKSVSEIVELFTSDFLENLEKLNINTEGTTFPRATIHIMEQISLVKTLEEKGYAYRTSDGIYFDTSKFKDYGKLGKIDISHLKEGARVAVNPDKKNPTDFALWKFSKPLEHREQEWDSPWGKGFPGWHLECSAMSTKYLGRHFDIHTGGIDHIPTHHNNEIAQSEAAFGRKFVNYWLHGEHLRIDGRKISKSLGNVILISNIASRGISPLAFRYWLLTSHYRTPVNFTWQALEASGKAYFRLEQFFIEELGKHVGKSSGTYIKKFLNHMNNDLDTPQSIALIWELLKDMSVSNQDKKATLLSFDKVLGLGLDKMQKRLETMGEESIPGNVDSLLKERAEAREEKDFTKSDSLRDELLKLGFEVKDTESGQKLTRIRP